MTYRALDGQVKFEETRPWWHRSGDGLIETRRASVEWRGRLVYGRRRLDAVM